MVVAVVVAALVGGLVAAGSREGSAPDGFRRPQGLLAAGGAGGADGDSGAGGTAGLSSVRSPVPTSGPLDDQDLTAFLSATVADLAASWQRLLASSGVTPNARLVAFRAADQAVLSTGCGPVASDVGPFFCGADATIYLGLEFARAVLRQVGDMALVTVLAHEYGHDVQLVLGLRPVVVSAAFELQADCLGGAYAADVAARGLLEPGDAEEARALSRLAGDEGQTSDPHGSAAQREQAWLRGFQDGWAACL